MGLSRMASKCNICPQRDRCSRKRMEGLGYPRHHGLQHGGVLLPHRWCAGGAVPGPELHLL